MSDVIKDNSVVAMRYTLKDAEGTIIDESGNEELYYLHGAGNIVPGLESVLTGKKVGDKLDVVVPAAAGYGEREGEPKPVPKANFPDDIELEAGLQLFAEGPDGEVMPIWILAVEDETVIVDMNHPLAGVELHFSVEVTVVRDATEEELDHGHVHGPGGHHHH